MSFERGPAADLWRNTLEQIATLFGRLIYLSALRDPNTGEYEHFGLAQRYSEEEARAVLERSHKDLFAEWLNQDLEEQKRDLDRYLSSLDHDVRQVIATWIRIAPYRNLLPASALESERRLFISDLAMLLELLRREHGVAADQDS